MYRLNNRANVHRSNLRRLYPWVNLRSCTLGSICQLYKVVQWMQSISTPGSILVFFKLLLFYQYIEYEQQFSNFTFNTSHLNINACGVTGKNIPGQNIPGQNIPGQNIPGQNIGIKYIRTKHTGQNVPEQNTPDTIYRTKLTRQNIADKI